MIVNFLDQIEWLLQTGVKGCFAAALLLVEMVAVPQRCRLQDGTRVGWYLAVELAEPRVLPQSWGGEGFEASFFTMGDPRGNLERTWLEPNKPSLLAECLPNKFPRHRPLGSSVAGFPSPGLLPP